jgi:hypothetical protein
MNRRMGLVPLPAAAGLAALVLLLAGLGRAGPARAAPATVLCVQTGNASCFSTISAALAAAHTNDTIRVAAGTYVEFVTITRTVTLQGGWNASFTLRNPVAFPSVIRPPDSSFSVVNIQGLFSDTAAVAPTLDGFTITGGGGGNHGGGLRVTNSNAVVSNNIITGNVGYLLGGGVWVQNGAPLLSQNQIVNNRVAPGGVPNGGGVMLESTRATLSNNLIAGNVVSASAGYGGGVAVQGGGPVTLNSNTILGNAAAIITSTTPQFDVGYGGGVYVQNAPVTLSSNVIQSNTANAVLAAGFGGAYGYGGGVAIVNTAAFTLTGNTIMSNTAGYKYNVYLSGGGVEVESSVGSLTGNLIAYNHANGNALFGNGGGLAAFTSTVSLQGGQILSNTTARNCEGYGGGVYLSNSALTLDATRLGYNCAANTPFYGLGGGLALLSSPYTLTNAIVDHNRAFPNDTSVGGLFADANSPGSVINNTFADNKAQAVRASAPLTLSNNILMGATTGVSLTTALVPISATYNNFYNNSANARGFALDLTNIIINPLLDASEHLMPGSPAIDAGTRANAPATDFDGQPRPMAGTSGFYRFDIGADEFTGPAQVQRRLSQQPADFTLIGPGNPQENPGSTGSNDWIGYAVGAGDINGDGRTDLLAGAPNLSDDFDHGPNDAGRTFALFNTGARRLGVVDLYTTTASLEVSSTINQQHTAQAYAFGDINGDGAGDLLIGASGAANFGVTGTVFILPGGPSLSGTRMLTTGAQANYRLVSDQNTSTFGNANALAAGQLNGSGPDDIAVGEANATVGGRNQAGAIYVFFGRTNFPAVWNLGVVSASLTIWGPAANAELGKVAIADVNGDGQPDLIARSITTTYVFLGPLSPGVIDLAADSSHTLLGGLADGPLAAGDLDGDGHAEVIVGSGTQVLVIQASPASVLTTFTGVSASALHTLDWNGDGKADLVIGDRSAERAYVYFGRSGLSGTTAIEDRADWIIYGEHVGDQFGYSLASGDLDGDGGEDLVIGSRSHVVGDHPLHFDDAGAVYVLYGAPGSRRVFLPVVRK